MRTGCEDDAVLRSVTLGVVLSVLATACALVEPPVPVDTYVLQGWVRNLTGHPVALHVVACCSGVHSGAAQPASVPAHTEANVTYYVPLGGDWSIWADNIMIAGNDLIGSFGEECTLGVELAADGSSETGCNMSR